MSTWRVGVTLEATRPLTVVDLHTAVCGWLLALSQEGTPILRVTSTSETETTHLLNQLAWLGLDWDEAPHVGGDFAPYISVPTGTRYTAVAQQLYDNGDADYNKQGDLCLMPPLSGHISYTDPQLGHLGFDLSQTPAPVLTTAVGTPTAWFRQALDDHRQKITHAVRPASGQQDLPALILFYRLMEWVSPTWVHLPPIRHTAVADTVENLRGAGYLPNALFQHLLQLGWTPPRQQDLWFRSDARRMWRLSDLAPDPVAFDREALTALNLRYLARLSNADLAVQIQPFLEEYFGPLPRDPRWQETLAHIVRPALRTLGDAPDKAAWAFDEAYEMVADLPGTREEQHALLSRLVAELAHIVLLDKNTAVSILSALAEAFPHTAVDTLLMITFTGQNKLNDLPAIMSLLGKAQCLQRAATILKQ